MKKIISLSIAVLLAIVSFAGCGSEKTDTVNTETGTESVASNDGSSVASDTVGSSATETASETSSEVASIPEFTESQDFSWSKHNGKLTTVNFDTHYFNYHGRWETQSEGMKSHWTRPYIEFNFKGSSFTILCDDYSSLLVYIDGTQGTIGPEGVVNVSDGEHLIRIRLEHNQNVVFRGIETAGDISRAKSRDKYYMFIGDSLTAAVESHAVVIPEQLNADYSTYSCGGLALREGKGYYGMPSDRTQREGMEKAFCNWQGVTETGERTLYPFQNERQPDAIFVNIGTNDGLTGADQQADFVNRYFTFIEKLRKQYPAASIYVMLPKADHSSGWRHKIIEAACSKCVSDISNVTYVDSRAWNVEISSDGVHPTADGYLVYAVELMRAVGLI